MKKYISFFRLRFSMGLQYRIAAWAGVVTQFVWGFMEILMFQAFYQADETAFPMSFSAVTAYVWLQQAFLALFAVWMVDSEALDSIVNGNIAYELCRPVGIYGMWFSRNVANRMSKAALRCFPVLAVAALLPYPYGIAAPKSGGHFLLFVITMILGLAMAVSLCMLVYMLTFFTISPRGIINLFNSAMEFLAGAIIPLPFLPEKIQRVVEFLPFASIQNVPLRIYSGSMNSEEMARAVLLQIFWLITITFMGRLLCQLAQKRITVQGG